MQRSRRDFLRLAAQAGIAAPLILNGSGCAVLGHDRFDDETGLSLGYVTGDVTADGAVVWLRAAPGSAVRVEYANDTTHVGAASTSPVSVVSEADYTAQVPLRGLDAGSVYYYRGAVAGKKPGPVARFKTAPAPDDSAVVKFCFSGDTRESYKPFTIMDAIGSMQPDFFVHLGDTIYADRGGTASRLEEFWAKYRANRDDAPSRRFCSQASWYVMWDDHEVRDNYDNENPLARIGQRAFLDYWPVRHDTDDPTRIYRSFRWGKALELFLLDNRQYRDRKHGSMLGAKQKAWLLDAIAASTATFKVIASSVPLWRAPSRRAAAVRPKDRSRAGPPGRRAARDAARGGPFPRRLPCRSACGRARAGTRRFERRSCAARSRTTGRPCRCRAFPSADKCAARASSPSPPRSRSPLRRAARARRRSGASSSCRSRSARAARRTPSRRRRDRCRAARRRARAEYRTIFSASGSLSFNYFNY